MIEFSTHNEKFSWVSDKTRLIHWFSFLNFPHLNLSPWLQEIFQLACESINHSDQMYFVGVHYFVALEHPQKEITPS